MRVAAAVNQSIEGVSAFSSAPIRRGAGFDSTRPSLTPPDAARRGRTRPGRGRAGEDVSVRSGVSDWPASAPGGGEAALPEGSAVAPSQAAFIRGVEELAGAQCLRAHGQRNLMTVAWQYARRADWRLMTSRPSRAVIMSVTGLSDFGAVRC
jgi:hypothetical protein